eukprot:GHVU01087390.1.p1 GENE.GHVU01087390.1~~GHVU01087390.1.p1  ORF type:complete len:113 (-),score=9.62 GHVU01087390.1:160-498(-)
MRKETRTNKQTKTLVDALTYVCEDCYRRLSSARQPVPQSSLFPNHLGEMCAPSSSLLATCHTTFNQLLSTATKLEETVECPGGCVGDASAVVFGDPECYSPQSSVCLAAAHS